MLGRSVPNIKPSHHCRFKWTSPVAQADKITLRELEQKIEKAERRERKDISATLRPPKTHMGGYTLPQKIHNFNWLLKGGYSPKETSRFTPAPEAHEPHTVVLMEGRYPTRHGPGRQPGLEYVYRIVRPTDVERLVKKFNSASAPGGLLESMDKSVWPFIKQMKRAKKEQDKLARAQESEPQEMVDSASQELVVDDELPSDKLSDSMMIALQNATSETTNNPESIREIYLPLLETEPFFRPLLTFTFPTRPMAVSLALFFKCLMHGCSYHTFIAKNGKLPSHLLNLKMKHYLPCLTVDDRHLTAKSDKAKEKQKYYIQTRDLRVMRTVELTYLLAEYVVAARGGLVGLRRVLNKTKRTASRDQLRMGEPAADIVIDVGIGGSSWYGEEFYDKVVADFRDVIDRVMDRFPDIMRGTKDQYSVPIVLRKLDEFGRRYDMENGEVVPWPEALVTEEPISLKEYRKMTMRDTRLEANMAHKPSELDKQQLKERLAEFKQEREKLAEEASRHFLNHKIEIATWKCKHDGHVTYLS